MDPHHRDDAPFLNERADHIVAGRDAHWLFRLTVNECSSMRWAPTNPLTMSWPAT